jgi:hypothetical protein
MQKPDSIAGYQTAQGVSDHTDLLYIMAAVCQFFQLPLNLFSDALASRVYAIVCEAASIALSDEDVQLVFGKSVAQRSAHVFQMLGLSP